MPDRILRLTERLDYIPQPSECLGERRSTIIFQGLVSEHYLRSEAGDDLVDQALRIGVLVAESQSA